MIRIRKILLGLTAVCLMMISACADISDNDCGGKSNVSDMALLLSIDGLEVESNTRMTVGAVGDEDRVHTLTLFFFEQGNNRIGMFVDWIELSGSSLTMNANIPIPTAGKLVSASSAYNVIGVANAAAYFDAGWESEWVGKTEDEFRKELIATLPSSIPSNGLLMNGSAVKTAGNGLIEMKLTRNVARFDVENKVSQYELASAEIRNIYNKSSVTGNVDMNYANSVVRSGVSAVVEVKEGVNNQIRGNLYAFENRSATPTMGDRVTTCVIVELKHSSVSQYFRINVNPEEEAQLLRRNNVYSITITDVNSSGYVSADEAYNSTEEDLLDYTINNWDLGDNGMIISDSYSILALPVKTVQIGRDGTVGMTFNITTFSTLENPTPLAIKNENLDSGLAVSLSGNALVISATMLNDDNEIREGQITLTYAGLEATINVLQALKVDAFLKVSYADGWSGLFAAAGGDVTKDIIVNASGSWTAELIGDDGFSFNLNQYATEIHSDYNEGAFNVAAISANQSKTKRRNSFVIVSLDDDPLNCVAVVTLTQSVASEITISPAVELISFNGSKSVTTIGSESNVYTFAVSSESVDEEGNVSDVVLNAEILGENANNLFGCSVDENGVLKVWTLTPNSSSGNYNGKLKIYGGGSEMIIDLVQRPLALSVSAAQPTTVEHVGGSTGEFYLSIDDDAATCTVDIVTRGIGRDVFNHPVKLVYATSESEVKAGDVFPANTRLKIVYPKIYFPNREIDIRTTVTFTTNNGAKATYTFSQNKLTTDGVRIWSTYRSRWGSLTASGATGAYFGHFNDYIRSNGSALATPGSFSLISSSSLSDYGNSVPASTNWYQFSNNDASTAANYAGVNAYFNASNGNKLVVLQAGHGLRSNDTNTHSFAGPSKLGFNFVNSSVSGGGNVRINPDVAETRVYKFIMENGQRTISSKTGFGLYNDGINCGTTAYPEGAVPLLRYATGGSYNMVIDPKNNVVFHGDETVFYGSYFTNNNPTTAADKSAFMANYIDYLVNAAKYGQNFTEMMRDDLEGIAPIWDEVWGDNRWPVRAN